MVPRSEIDGIDINADWDEISGRLRDTSHTRMPLFDGDLDRVHGIVHMRLVANELASGRMTRERLREIAVRREALFTPEGHDALRSASALPAPAPAHRIRRRRVRRPAGTRDARGHPRGSRGRVHDPGRAAARAHRRASGRQPCRGRSGAFLREINRRLGSTLPVDGPRTLSGLIVERLESIPEPGAVAPDRCRLHRSAAGRRQRGAHGAPLAVLPKRTDFSRRRSSASAIFAAGDDLDAFRRLPRDIGQRHDGATESVLGRFA